MYRCSSTYRFLVYGNIDLIKACGGSLFRVFSASSHKGSMPLDEDNEKEQIEQVYTFDFNAFLGERKENGVLIKGSKGNSSVAGKPPSRVLHGGKALSFIFRRNSEIIGIVKRNDNNMERNLSSVAPVLSFHSIVEIFEALNCHNVSGLRFFRWAHSRDLDLRRTAGFYSLIINNCGWLNDYKTMENLLKEFRKENICLTEKAFEFLPLFRRSSQESVENSIKRVVHLLNEVGGSCRNSGIHGLIQMLSGLGLFEMVKFVIKLTEKTTSYFNILIRGKCSRGDIDEPYAIIKEMREFGCDPDANTYNYILGSLCKSNRLSEACSFFEEMQENGTSPDPISYEILIYSFCGLGNFERAFQFMNQMVSEGVRPRFTTHAAIIKSLVNAEKCKEAYKYVIDSSLKDPMSSNMNYNLLANLHQKKDVVSAMKIILEMMDKGLNLNHRLYFKVISRLRNSGKESLAEDLKNRYNRFKSPQYTSTG